MHDEADQCEERAGGTPRGYRRVLLRAALLVTILGTCLTWIEAGQTAEPASMPQVVIVADHTNGVYAMGHVIRWRVELKGDALTNGVPVKYAVKKGGLTILQEGRLEFTNEVADVAITPREPGTFLFEVKLPQQDGKKPKFLAGAVVAPAAVRPSALPPKDFDAFWKAKLDELSEVPLNLELTGADGGKPGVDYWKVIMGNIRGTHIRGQLARPRSGEKFPAMLILQGAGVYRLEPSWVTHRAVQGWLALNLNAHDLPIDREPAFYEEQAKGPLKSYWKIGSEDREKSYFLRMYLACYRAAQYLTERPDWDGKTLLAIGASQGGLQALVAAGLHPEVTAVIAEVPGGCDLTGVLVGRQSGWPAYYFQTQGTNSPNSIEASRYYDVVNLIPRIKCPVLASAGLIDEICAPAGILAAMNMLAGPKEMVLLPQADHMGSNDSHREFKIRSSAWVKALRDGRPVPPPR
jgi:cephalosporin-C deacetylase